jgi:hypothetical protein
VASVHDVYISDHDPLSKNEYALRVETEATIMATLS